MQPLLQAIQKFEDYTQSQGTDKPLLLLALQHPLFHG